MDADLDVLAGLTARLRSLDAVGVEIAEEALPAVLKAAQATAAAGTTPSGEAWAPTKEGRRALPNAAAAIKAVVSGTSEAVITLIADAPYWAHQRSKGGRLPRREVLFDPEDGVPPPMADAIARVAQRVVARRIGGGR